MELEAEVSHWDLGSAGSGSVESERKIYFEASLCVKYQKSNHWVLALLLNVSVIFYIYIYIYIYICMYGLVDG